MSQSAPTSPHLHSPIRRFRSSSEAILDQLSLSRREVHQIPCDADAQLKDALFVGHVNTDLDSVAGAIGAACLFNGKATISESASSLNGEILYALKHAKNYPIPPQFTEVEKYESHKICLVDHTEKKQMVPEIAESLQKNIVGVIDHHALASSFSTEAPIYMQIKPWGSMSSIVTQLFVQKNRVIPEDIASLLLSAILSDTLNLKSPTTTDGDRFCVCLLALRCGMQSTKEIDTHALAMFKAKTEWICSLGAQKMCRADCKVFEAVEGGKTEFFGIAVLEIAGSPQPVLDVANEAAKELGEIKKEKGLKYCFLCVVDVLTQTSVVVCGSDVEMAITERAFCCGKTSVEGATSPASDATTVASGISEEEEILEAKIIDVGNFASRKKQFMPRYMGAIKKIM